MRLIAAATVLSLGFLLVSCAGGEPATDAGDASGAAAASAADPAQPPARANHPASPAPAPGNAAGNASAASPATPPVAAGPGGLAVPYPSDLAAHAGLRVDCQQDSECAVKDVGNCCGRYDACVRADAQPDTAAVQAECADQALVGICGFPVIEACVCTAGTCQAAPADGTGADHAVK